MFFSFSQIISMVSRVFISGSHLNNSVLLDKTVQPIVISYNINVFKSVSDRIQNLIPLHGISDYIYGLDRLYGQPLAKAMNFPGFITIINVIHLHDFVLPIEQTVYSFYCYFKNNSFQIYYI